MGVGGVFVGRAGGGDTCVGVDSRAVLPASQPPVGFCLLSEGGEETAMCEHVALGLLLSWGVSPVSPRPVDSRGKTAPLLTFCLLAVCDLGLVVPRPGPQFPPFQNEQYSCVVV